MFNEQLTKHRLIRRRCPTCSSENATDSRYCIFCGRFLGIRYCAFCGTPLSLNQRYCVNCGMSVKDSLATIASNYSPGVISPHYYRKKKLARLSIIGVVSALLVSLANFLFLIPATVAVLAEGLPAIPIYLFIPFPIHFFTIPKDLAFGYALFVFFSLFACIGYLFWTDGRNAAKIIRKGWKNWDAPSLSHQNSVLLLVVQLFMVLFVTNALVALLFVGNSAEGTSASIDSPALLLFLLANAVIFEELTFRVLLIGLPLLAFDYLGRREQKRKITEYLLVGNSSNKIGVPEATLIILSSILFALAHVFGGWGLWKLLTTFPTGLALGYLFVKKGLPAAVLLHFCFNYLTAPLLVFLAFNLWSGFLLQMQTVLIFSLIALGISLIVLLMLLCWLLTGSVYLVELSRIFRTQVAMSKA
jgi:membrane protease YdiL (CAAX protease family)